MSDETPFISYRERILALWNVLDTSTTPLQELLRSVEEEQQLCTQLHTHSLLPPWVIYRELSGGQGTDPWYGDTRTTALGLGECGWHPLEDYQYAFWLMRRYGLDKYGLPIHDSLEDIPRAVIHAALVVANVPLHPRKKD